MSVVDPIPIEDISHPKIKEIMAVAAEWNVPDQRFFQILAHAPGYAQAIFDAMHLSFAEGNVDHKLKEIMRIQLARQAQAPYFASMRSKKAIEEGLTEDRIAAGYGDFENEDQFSNAEKWALRYTSLMYTEPKKVNGDFYAEGKKHYSEAEIMELGSFIALHYGVQVFFRTLGVGGRVKVKN